MKTEVKIFVLVVLISTVLGQDTTKKSDDVDLITKVNSLEKKLDALIEANGIFMSSVGDWLRIKSKSSGVDGNLLKLLGQNFAKGSLFVNSTTLEHMSIQEMKNQAKNMTRFLSESQRKRELNGVSYEIMTDHIGDFHEFILSHRDLGAQLCKESNRSLLLIKSEEENEFIAKWLFDDLKVKNLVWLGLKRENISSNNFIWDDGTVLEVNGTGYSNWFNSQPRGAGAGGMANSYLQNHVKAKEARSMVNVNVNSMYRVMSSSCVVMFSNNYLLHNPQHSSVTEIKRGAGFWTEVLCQSLSVVVCQKEKH